VNNQTCPFKVGDRVVFKPNDRTIGLSYPTFGRERLEPGDSGVITRIDKGQYLYLDDDRGGFHWECFSPALVTLIREAGEFLAGKVRRTPVEYSKGLSELLGVPVWLKLESLQLTGSFKIRGAMFAVSKLNEAVITCSAGNHGKAVAYVKKGATICVPRSVDRSKLTAMVAMGADVRVSEFGGYDETQDWALEIAARENKYFLSAFDDDAVMAANGGTVAMEVLEDAPEARSFILPVGGGGLSAGFAVWAKDKLADSEMIGCQHELSPALRMSLDAGHAITRLPAVETLAGGVEGGIGACTFPVLQPLVDGEALVSEAEIWEGVRWMIAEHQYLIEPTAAVTIAACISGKMRVKGPAVVVVSGRNVSMETVRKILCGF
jgi:threonine dehydratase